MRTYGLLLLGWGLSVYALFIAVLNLFIDREHISVMFGVAFVILAVPTWRFTQRLVRPETEAETADA